MRIHLNTDTPNLTLIRALRMAREAGRIAPSTDIEHVEVKSSRSHTLAVEVHLAADDKAPGERRFANTSYQQADDDRRMPYAATYDEWGWFLSHLFDAHPDARAVGPRTYKNRDDFHAQTNGAFELTQVTA